MDPDDLPVPRLRLRRDAVARGWSDDELAALTRAGSLTRLRRGAYVDGGLPETDVASTASSSTRRSLPCVAPLP